MSNHKNKLLLESLISNTEKVIKNKNLEKKWKEIPFYDIPNEFKIFAATATPSDMEDVKLILSRRGFKFGDNKLNLKGAPAPSKNIYKDDIQPDDGKSAFQIMTPKRNATFETESLTEETYYAFKNAILESVLSQEEQKALRMGSDHRAYEYSKGAPKHAATTWGGNIENEDGFDASELGIDDLESGARQAANYHTDRIKQISPTYAEDTGEYIPDFLVDVNDAYLDSKAADRDLPKELMDVKEILSNNGIKILSSLHDVEATGDDILSLKFKNVKGQLITVKIALVDKNRNKRNSPEDNVYVVIGGNKKAFNTNASFKNLKHLINFIESESYL